MIKDTYQAHLMCYNCGHQWYRDIKKGYRLYTASEINKCVISLDINLQKTPLQTNQIDAEVICPYCNTFSKIQNITSCWASQNGYNNKIGYDKDNPEEILKSKKALEENKKKVIEMEKNKFKG